MQKYDYNDRQHKLKTYCTQVSWFLLFICYIFKEHYIMLPSTAFMKEGNFMKRSLLYDDFPHYCPSSSGDDCDTYWTFTICLCYDNIHYLKRNVPKTKPCKGWSSCFAQGLALIDAGCNHSEFVNNFCWVTIEVSNFIHDINTKIKHDSKQTPQLKNKPAPNK